MKSKNIKNQTLYFLLSMVFLTLSFPSYSVNSKVIILLVIYWLFYNTIKEKIILFKSNYNPFIIIFSLFGLYAFSLLVTNDLDEGLRLIIKRLSLVILPLIIFTIKIDKKTIYTLLYYFSVSVVIASAFALIKALYFKYNNLGSYLNYSDFSMLLEKHTTYFSLFVVIAILFFIKQIQLKKSLINILFIVYLLVIVYMLSVRISILALSIGIIILFYKQIKPLYLFFGILVISSAFYLSPNFQKRFTTIKRQGELFDINYRLKQWSVITDVVRSENLFLGLGLGSDRKLIYQSYKKNNLNNAFREKYNAHNQYIEFYIYGGIMGFIGFLIVIFFIAQILFKKELIYLSLYSVFLIFMITESILERHSGIVIFSLLISLMLHSNKQLK